MAKANRPNPTSVPTEIHPEKWFGSKITAFVVSIVLAIGSFLVTVNQFRLGEGCFIFAAIWAVICIVFLPYFVSPFDGKKVFYLWALALLPLIIGVLIVYGTEQYRISSILNANEGWLLPAGDYVAGSCYAPEQNYLTLLLGSTAVATNSFPQEVIKVHGHSLLSVSKIERRMAISAEIASNDTRDVAIIEKNHWEVNPNNVMSKHNPDFSTLTVYDQYHKRVLDVRYMNECTFRIYLILHYEGVEVELNEKGVFLNGNEKVSSLGWRILRPDISVMEVADYCRPGTTSVCLHEH